MAIKGSDFLKKKIFLRGFPSLFFYFLSNFSFKFLSESQAKMRCKLRKLYFLKRNKICDLSLALAIIGLFFVVLDQGKKRFYKK